ncbi:MAG: MarR family winged helix-turn-helix transcriptional regulator [Steroidobacteraceae bacterium]|nr:winged helix-turn-helix transcriptional regulator [Steroidobacteraceae bacterium]MBP7012574.1 winged helix-turn-helix transcriptional regulator [Steroidobacteraceae bacterium]
MTRDTIRERDLQRFRRTNIGQPLIEIAKDFQRRVLTRFAERGHTGLQPAHTAVITNLNLEGTRLTELARHASMTKQGMGQLVDELQRLGYVERVPDPTDNRAKIVRFSERGRRLMLHGVESGDLIQREYARLIGRERLQLLHDILEHLKNRLRDQVAQAPQEPTARTRRRPRS